MSLFRYMSGKVRSDWKIAATESEGQSSSEEGLVHSYWAYDIVSRMVVVVLE